ncbi:MAG: hypothetical protein NPINA01_03670 [Nitrospinaceae bacterium]|nr:MAG: hypothetical protein NPINA01_03670 [Nitrospinaceae bacterium]
MITNFLQNFFLTSLGPEFSYLGTVANAVAFVVLVFLLPALLFLCQRSMSRCYQELRRHNRQMETQTQCIEEMNRWMQLSSEKILKGEKIPIPEKKVVPQKKRLTTPARPRAAKPPQPAKSPYKKTIG